MQYSEFHSYFARSLIDPTFNYNEKLCKKVSGENVVLWECDWLKGKNLLDLLKTCDIVDEQEINTMEPVISEQEFDIFVYLW